MDGDRLRCAKAALRQVPDGYRKVDAADVVGQERGHSFQRGMHIGWAWGKDRRGRVYLDFLYEHRHPGMHAERLYSDGSTEPIRTPASMRAVSPDSAEDAELERKFFEDNQAAYADLRNRGLLPPEGQNIGAQDINEYLLKGDSRTEDVPEEPELARYDRHEELLGGGWDEVLRDEMAKPYWRKLLEFVAVERAAHPVYPPPSQTFRAFELTPYDEVRVVILGQDPYPNEGEADGLAFSVRADVRPKPGSLRNIHKVLESDLSAALARVVNAPDHGSLEAWADQGVLLLNTALTVRAGDKEDRDSHRLWRWEKQGWTTFTDAVMRAVNDKPDHVVFVLWGNDAKKKAKLIDTGRHAVIKSSHPSPNFGAADLGFLASRPFSETNEKLRMAGRGEVDWLRPVDGT